MFDKLTEHLERGFKILKGQGRITEINISESLKEIRRALVEADVNYKIAKTFVDEVKEKALGQNVLTAIKPGELMVKIVHDEMSKLMGGDAAPLHIDGRPAMITRSPPRSSVSPPSRYTSRSMRYGGVSFSCSGRNGCSPGRP